MASPVLTQEPAAWWTWAQMPAYLLSEPPQTRGMKTTFVQSYARAKLGEFPAESGDL